MGVQPEWGGGAASLVSLWLEPGVHLPVFVCFGPASRFLPSCPPPPYHPLPQPYWRGCGVPSVILPPQPAVPAWLWCTLRHTPPPNQPYRRGCGVPSVILPPQPAVPAWLWCTLRHTPPPNQPYRHGCGVPSVILPPQPAVPAWLWCTLRHTPPPTSRTGVAVVYPPSYFALRSRASKSRLGLPHTRRSSSCVCGGRGKLLASDEMSSSSSQQPLLCHLRPYLHPRP